MSESPSSAISNSSTSQLGLLSTPAFSQLVSVKLTQDSYRLWTAQVLSYLKSQGLVGFVDGTISSPSQTIVLPPSEEGGERRIAVNPEFTR
ncbi:hypothetical protein E2562_027876 [Oryza meyeriana var. granulata]|uniref:Retrotransposon Copia-like N-terminal domain-containing protein n=1 Tax=Oryza meyeriana var. granulata TaxID=110450 RepID=A0A6G1CS64_9ORYZ|nr:hypothetical protein E2562_027876 [Oryza meyeriana var. granulata]